MPSKLIYVVQIVLDEWEPAEHWTELTKEQADDLAGWLETQFDIGNIKDYHLGHPTSEPKTRILLMTSGGLRAELQRDLAVNQTIKDCRVKDNS